MSTRSAILRAKHNAYYAYGTVVQSDGSVCNFVPKAACRKCGRKRNSIQLVKGRTLYHYACACGAMGPTANNVGTAKALWNQKQKGGKT